MEERQREIQENYERHLQELATPEDFQNESEDSEDHLDTTLEDANNEEGADK